MLRTVAARASSPNCTRLVVVWISASIPSSDISATRKSRTQACSGEPVGCGRRTISTSVDIARDDENTESGAFAGTGRGRPVRVLANADTRRRATSVTGPRHLRFTPSSLADVAAPPVAAAFAPAFARARACFFSFFSARRSSARAAFSALFASRAALFAACSPCFEDGVASASPRFFAVDGVSPSNSATSASLVSGASSPNSLS